MNYWLFEGFFNWRNYSRAETIRGNTIFKIMNHTVREFSILGLLVSICCCVYTSYFLRLNENRNLGWFIVLVWGSDWPKRLVRPNFCQTSTVQFDPKTELFSAEHKTFFLLLCSVLMASFHIFVLLNDLHWSLDKIAKRMPKL